MKQREQLFVALCQWLRDGSSMDRRNEALIAAFATTLRTARGRAGLTQEELAERSEVSVRAVSFMETGKRQPSLSALAALAQGLGMPMSRLVAEIEDVEPERVFPDGVG